MNIDTQQLKYYHPKLRKLLPWLEESTGLNFTITSQYRIDDDGVHGMLPLRGTDLRMRIISIGRKIETHINENWHYDPDRPDMKCAILHGEGSELHLHIQVHHKTRRVI